MACGKVTYEVEGDHYADDIISHGGECASKACHTKIELMMNGFIPCRSTPPLWCAINKENNKI
jgi:hypothetical protein